MEKNNIRVISVEKALYNILYNTSAIPAPGACCRRLLSERTAQEAVIQPSGIVATNIYSAWCDEVSSRELIKIGPSDVAASCFSTEVATGLSLRTRPVS